MVGRKGVYTDLAKWAKARGHSHLRIDGEFVKVDPFPRIDRFKEHTIELPVADMLVNPANEAALRQALPRPVGAERRHCPPRPPRTVPPEHGRGDEHSG